jgi:hypothetical protein
MPRCVATTNNAMEAAVILGRLQEARVPAWPSRALTGRGSMAGVTDIYVEDGDLEAARQALATAQDVDEAELTRLAEESGPPPRD